MELGRAADEMWWGWGNMGWMQKAGDVLGFVLQANVEHLTDKMKTDIQRGLVLR